MRDEKGNIIIIDWKRSKGLKYENPHAALQYPLQHLPDTNYFLYALQLNVYRSEGLLILPCVTVCI